MSQGKSTQSLQGKEAALFRDVIKHYEGRNYKKGLKTAEVILKKHPDHGETLAMKGLFKKLMGGRDEGFELARQGVLKNLKSPVCWHVYGLIYRDDKNYPEAIRSYMKALEFEPTNGNILRDLSTLQIQVRDFKGFLETRRKILSRQSSNKLCWYSFAVASHLNDLHQQALDVFDTYASMDKGEHAHADGSSCGSEECPGQGTQELAIERNNIVLYKALVLEEAGRIQEAAALLEAEKKSILDGSQAEEQRASLFLKLHEYAKARPLYEHLLVDNADNYERHYGWQQSILELPQHAVSGADLSGLDEAQKAKLREVYRAPSAENRTYLRFLLSLIHGEELQEKLVAYLKASLRKGCPALYQEVKHLMKPEESRTIILETVRSFQKSLEQSRCFPGESEKQKDTVVESCHLFLAQHLDHEKQYDLALKEVDRAFALLPDSGDAYLKKARILKHQGKLLEAATLLDEGRGKDLADRFLNAKTAKYYLRANEIEKAGTVFSLFSRSTTEYNRDIKYMQIIWYELESAAAQWRLHNVPMALKWYSNIVEHYQEFVDDMFDFHFYSVRRASFLSYYRALRYVDTIFQEKPYVAAVKGCVQCYLELAIHPFVAPPESKKKSDAPKKAAAVAKGKKDEMAMVPKDDDPTGRQAAAKVKPKEAVETLLDSVLNVDCRDVDLYLMLHAAALESKRYLKAIKCLVHAIRLAPAHPLLLKALEEWKMLSADLECDAVTKKIVEEFNQKLKGAATLASLFPPL